MPPCFKARFGIKCLIKVPWHVIKHLAKAAFPMVFSAKQPLCKGWGAEGGGGREQAVYFVTLGGGAGFKSCRTYCRGTHPPMVFHWHHILPASTSQASLCCLYRQSIVTESYRQYWLLVPVCQEVPQGLTSEEGLCCTMQ